MSNLSAMQTTTSTTPLKQFQVFRDVHTELKNTFLTQSWPSSMNIPRHTRTKKLTIGIEKKTPVFDKLSVTELQTQTFVLLGKDSKDSSQLYTAKCSKGQLRTPTEPIPLLWGKKVLSPTWVQRGVEDVCAHSLESSALSTTPLGFAFPKTSSRVA